MTANTSSRVAALSLMLALVSQTSAFLPHAKTSLLQNQNVLSTAKPAAALNMFMDPATMVESANTFMDSASTNLLSFTDQGQNLAGVFFQASLLPYLLFLYFLSFRANRISDLGNFGFQFILLFVLSTIPAGIISKVVYGTSLANVDFLHGGAETLLTVANVLI